MAFPPMGNAPGSDGGDQGGHTYTPWLTQVQSYRCPSDPIVHAGQAQTNYATCYGDGVRYVGANFGGATGSVPQDDGCKRGVFTRNYFFRFRDILDGTSNTVAMGEICVGDGADRLAKAHILLDDGANFTSSQTVRTNPSLCLRGPHIDSARPQFLTTAGTNFIRGRRWQTGIIPIPASKPFFPRIRLIVVRTALVTFLGLCLQQVSTKAVRIS